MGSSSDQSPQKSSPLPVSVQTVLRLRPLLKRERDDPDVLKPLDTTTVVMGPQPAVQMLSPSSALVKQTIDPENNHDEEFYFDLVLRSNSTQESMYFSFGSNVAQQAMEPLKASRENRYRRTSLIITMGLSNSGKTFSCWGDHCLSTQKLPQDGMLPRILDSLFAQSAHFVEKKHGLSFGVQISVVQVGNRDGVLNDLLKSSSRRSIRSTISSLSNRQLGGNSPFPSHNSVMIEQDPSSLECRLKNQQRKLCLSWEDARLTLKKAVKIRHDNAKPGHVLVQVRPVMVNRSHKVVENGGQIAILEMESLDNGKKIKAGRIKDSIPNRTDAYGSVMQCLRVALDNQNDPSHAKNVPFVQHKVTMLLQPMFSRDNTDSTDVTVLVTAYPGDRDYIEKKELLRDLQPLRQKCRTNAAFTGTSSGRSTISEQEENKALIFISRKYTSLRKHSHDFSSGGERKAKEEMTYHNQKSPGKLASSVVSGKSKISCDRDALLKHLDSSVEDIVPLPPPPVAPGYRPESSLLANSKSEKTRIVSPHLVAVRKASAPVEETMPSPGTSRALADFPGVVVPQNMISRKETKEESTQMSRRQWCSTAEEARGDDENYINFTSEEAEVYHADKIEQSQVARSTFHLEQDSGRSFEFHNASLQNRLAFLCKENESLRAENERINREFTYLKQSLENSVALDLRWKPANKNTTTSADGTGIHDRSYVSNEASHYAPGTRDFAKEPLASDITNRYL